jgi:hypothetical protein
MEQVFFSFIISPATGSYSLIGIAKDAQGVNIVQPLVLNGLTMEEALAQQAAFYAANNPR